jgi:hypothetical protein
MQKIKQLISISLYKKYLFARSEKNRVILFGLSVFFLVLQILPGNGGLILFIQKYFNKNKNTSQADVYQSFQDKILITCYFVFLTLFFSISRIYLGPFCF